MTKLIKKHKLEKEVQIITLVHDGIRWGATYELTTRPFSPEHSQVTGQFLDELFQMGKMSPTFTNNPTAPERPRKSRSTQKRA